MFNSPRRYQHDVFTRHTLDGREAFETGERKVS